MILKLNIYSDKTERGFPYKYCVVINIIISMCFKYWNNMINILYIFPKYLILILTLPIKKKLH